VRLTLEAQMRANARAWISEAEFPATVVLEEPPATGDQCYLSCSPAAVNWADLIMDRWDFMDGSPDHRPYGVPAAVHGWRERGKAGNLQYRWAAHLIEHHHPTDGRACFSLDFDSHSPNQGLIYAIGHVFGDYLYQKLFKKKTSPFTVAKARGWTTEAI
jgi:hypothetical protein